MVGCRGVQVYPYLRVYPTRPIPAGTSQVYVDVLRLGQVRVYPVLPVRNTILVLYGMFLLLLTYDETVSLWHVKTIFYWQPINYNSIVTCHQGSHVTDWCHLIPDLWTLLDPEHLDKLLLMRLHHKTIWIKLNLYIIDFWPTFVIIMTFQRQPAISFYQHTAISPYFPSLHYFFLAGIAFIC